MTKKRKSLLLISKYQFGHLVDHYEWCVNLKDSIDITVISQFENKPLVELEGINVIYIPAGNAIKTRIGIIEVLRNLNSNNPFDSFLISYFRMCFIIRLVFPFKTSNAILDIRTLDINESSIKRFISNSLLRFETFFFKKISIISDGIRRQIYLPKRKCFILPLGATLSPIMDNKNLNNIFLIYVGTFHLRNIEDTVSGFKIYIDKYWDKERNPKIEFDIIGTGSTTEVELIEELISTNNLQNQIRLHGYIPNQQLAPLLNKATIGVSYVPITGYFKYQPPTKTYEYLAAGLPTLATNTISNSEIINNLNGVLIDDNPTSFALGLEKIIKNYSIYTPEVIQDTIKNNTWREISKVLASNILFDQKRIRNSKILF